MSAPKNHSAYLVTASSIDQMKVGSIMIDKGAQDPTVWDVIDLKTGESQSATGVRLARLCGTCRMAHKVVGLREHEGECGTEEVKVAATAEIEKVRAEKVEALSLQVP